MNNFLKWDPYLILWLLITFNTVSNSQSSSRDSRGRQSWPSQLASSWGVLPSNSWRSSRVDHSSLQGSPGRNQGAPEMSSPLALVPCRWCSPLPIGTRATPPFAPLLLLFWWGHCFPQLLSWGAASEGRVLFLTFRTSPRDSFWAPIFLLSSRQRSSIVPFLCIREMGLSFTVWLAADDGGGNKHSP